MLNTIRRQRSTWRCPQPDGSCEAATVHDTPPAGSAKRAPSLYGAGRQADGGIYAALALLHTISQQCSTWRCPPHNGKLGMGTGSACDKPHGARAWPCLHGAGRQAGVGRQGRQAATEMLQCSCTRSAASRTHGAARHKTAVARLSRLVTRCRVKRGARGARPACMEQGGRRMMTGD